MKILLTTLLIFSFSAMADEDVTGTWALSGVGCRNQSMDASSHVSKYLSDGQYGLQAATFNFTSSGSASMTALVNNQTETQTGTYTIESGEVIIKDPSMSDEQRFKLKIVGDSLVARGSDDESEQVCGSNQFFVYVVDAVD